MLLRYALQLIDTAEVGDTQATLLTEGTKSSKETLFFLTQDSEVEEKTQKPNKKPPVKSLNGSISPAKNKTVGGKVLRTKTRSAAQEEVLQSTAAKIGEHQSDLHAQLQKRGLEKYSEEGGARDGQEGKQWKRFQSYKGEAGLPKEIEDLRVRTSSSSCVGND
jgi:nucleosome binding factor SPN SPT16 subunit